MDFKTLLKSREFLFLDGATGTLIQKSGVSYDHNPETLNMTHPDLITSFHRAYIDAGSDLVYANTFGANSYKLEGCGYTTDAIIKAALQNAKAATEGTEVLVALDVGPIGQLLEPAGALSFEDAYDLFAEEMDAADEADVIVIETMTDLYEAKAAVLAAREHAPGKPILVTMTFETTGRTFAGVSAEAAALTLSGLGVSALGVNCSLGPKDLEPVIERMSHYTDLPLIFKPNAGLPDPNSSEYDIGPQEFADAVRSITKHGLKLVGGCCGTTPEYIACMKKALADVSYTPQTKEEGPVVCSASTIVHINGPRIIGERINPTGKKLFKKALQENNIDYILNQALSQVEAGAEILDVNVGLPEIDEKEMMVKVLKAIQGVCDAPLQVDSTKPDVLEAALRAYNGRPIVNSVNGEEKSLSTVLPLVKKYGATVVGLTLDENGIPKTAEERFQIAKRIVERAEALGIPREDVFIDCLTLTVSAEQAACKETLEGLHRVKTELGCKMALGVSNISFGLPYRELVNSTFLTMALEEGLDLPIINPNVDSMTGAVRAFRVLRGIDENSLDYISSYQNYTPPAAGGAAPAAPASGTPASNAPTDTAETAGASPLQNAVLKGLKTEGANATKTMLESKDPLSIVNEELIPALDKVGADFEAGKIFLPQLIQSANAAQECFTVIKEEIARTGSGSVSKGKVILATVKGDIHDIGKNIVKVLLDNYGYTVIDLGRDVDPKLIVETALKEDIEAVGLSALMTTTLSSMEETIALLRKEPALQNADGTSKVNVMVGGAVVTPDYAERIGADFYCRDAKATVDACKSVFKN
ncbi:MAG: homocysteine S-methyltransferase family protein [Acutalibacteraceae bacterium]|nr:homocysteine S-methyltransferase family protein [Acutalibacteraceae bacterium]